MKAFHAACQDPEIPRWTGFDYGLTRQTAVRLIEERIAGFQSGTSAAFAVVDGSTDRLLGSVSLLWIDWERSVAEAAYWLRKDERGRGVATRALRLLAAWTLTDLGIARVELTADVRNEASQRVAERAGFRREGLRRAAREIHGEAIDEVVFSLTKESAAKVRNRPTLRELP